ncbi:WGR domain-containing protein (plasmid) [Microvirga sp. RSM25]|uniref:WGR domain-containing protein n=1 Tax=Microvirga sp. RSM25 TaxID=3273802 RepID=UPI003851125E
MLYRRDPEQGRARFFSLMIERDLFGTIRLVHNWGFVGCKGKEKVEIFPDEVRAAEALGSRPAEKGLYRPLTH